MLSYTIAMQNQNVRGHNVLATSLCLLATRDVIPLMSYSGALFNYEIVSLNNSEFALTILQLPRERRLIEFFLMRILRLVYFRVTNIL
jgi:hypothetical protein